MDNVKKINVGAGTIVWWSLKGSIPVERINASLRKRGLKEFAKLSSKKHAFRRAWQQFGTARHDSYIPRMVFKKKIEKVYREVIGLIKEGHEQTGEKLTHNQYATVVYSAEDKNVQVFYRCSCGVIILAEDMLKYHGCSCGKDIPNLAKKIIAQYIDLSTNLGSMERAGQVGDYIKKMGIISLSGGGRPFYTPDDISLDEENPTPEDKKGVVELFLDAVREWGDMASCLPLKAEGMPVVEEFSFLSIKGELDSLEKEISEWGDTTRVSTKAKRLERLFGLDDKISLYSRVLGKSETLLKQVTSSLEKKISDEINFKKKVEEV